MTTIRQQILDAVGTALGNISGVETSERLIKDWAAVNGSERTWVGYMPRKATIEHHCFDSMTVTLPIMIYAHVAGSDTDARDNALLDLQDQILATMLATPQWGIGCVIDTLAIEDESDIGDPDTASSNAGGVSGTMVGIFNISYERTTAAQ